MTAANRDRAKGILAGLASDGATADDLTALLGLGSFADVLTRSHVPDTQGKLVATILGLQPGINSLDGWRTADRAWLGKIRDPSKFSAVLGYGYGGVAETEGPVWVGERGPEVLAPRADLPGIMAAAIRQAPLYPLPTRTEAPAPPARATREVTINFTLQVSGDVRSPEALMAAVRPHFQQLVRDTFRDDADIILVDRERAAAAAAQAPRA